MKVADGGGRMFFEMWQKKKKLPLFHHILKQVTFQYEKRVVTQIKFEVNSSPTVSMHSQCPIFGHL